jgi:hypothetical protein
MSWYELRDPRDRPDAPSRLRWRHRVDREPRSRSFFGAGRRLGRVDGDRQRRLGFRGRLDHHRDRAVRDHVPCGNVLLRPESGRLGKLEAEGPTSPKVLAKLQRLLALTRADLMLLFLIAFDMSVKPSWGDGSLDCGAGYRSGRGAARAQRAQCASRRRPATTE